MISLTIIKKPVISEKSFKDAERGTFTFEVEKTSNKIEIKKAIEESFKVHVTSITTSIMKGKNKTVGKTRRTKKLPDSKKARVRLKKGERIELFEVGGK